MTQPTQDPSTEDAEHGVLADTGAVDTAAVGIFGPGTAQVSVDLNLGADDDDDDVVDDGLTREQLDAAFDSGAVPVLPGRSRSKAAPKPRASKSAATKSAGSKATGTKSAAAKPAAKAAATKAAAAKSTTAKSQGAKSTATKATKTKAGSQAGSKSGAAAKKTSTSTAATKTISDTAADTATPAEKATPSRATTASKAKSGAAKKTTGARKAATSGSARSTNRASATGAVPTQDTITDDAEAPPYQPAPARGPATPASPAVSRARVVAVDDDIIDADVIETGEVQTVAGRALVHTPVRVSNQVMTSERITDGPVQRESTEALTPDRLLSSTHPARSEPEGTWRRVLYTISGGLINVGDSKEARAEKDLLSRIGTPIGFEARFVPVVSRKGGVGKTTVTMLLGMALADARDDRIIAIDANPDRGTLSDRITRPSNRTVRDLVRGQAKVQGYADISQIVARDETRLDVLASDADPRVSKALSDKDYRDVAALAAQYYSVVLTDTGTGIVHSVMDATLEAADEFVIVSGLSVDEARLASETLSWLEANGYGDQVRNAIVVLNASRPGTPLVRLDELQAHFSSRVRTVIRIPYDQHLGTGSAISFRDLEPATRTAARELAAAVVSGLRSPVSS